MPRQALAKSAKVPLPPLNGEEVCFWLHILADHALFLQAGLMGEDPALADEAHDFYQKIHDLRCRAEQSRKMAEIVSHALPVLLNFYQFQQQLVSQMLVCELHGHLYPLQVDHFVRENGYAIRLFEKIQCGKRTWVNTKAQETLFWVRIMEDHSQFIGSLTDPSERNVVATARSFAHEFDDLYLQGRDFVSLLDRNHQEIPAFARYLDDTRRAVCRLRDFKKLVEELIHSCRLVGILPEQLADHFRREAEHYLMILALIEKNMLDCDESFEEEFCSVDPDLATYVDRTEDVVVDQVKQEALSPDSGKHKWSYQYQKSSKLDLDEEDCGREEPSEVVESSVVVESSEAVEPESVAATPTIVRQPAVEEKPKGRQAKHQSPQVKWSDHWPRPLGKKSK